MTKYFCAQCGGEITVQDAAAGRLVTINVDGHAKPAHRTCPDEAAALEALRLAAVEAFGEGTTVEICNDPECNER